MIAIAQEVRADSSFENRGQKGEDFIFPFLKKPLYTINIECICKLEDKDRPFILEMGDDVSKLFLSLTDEIYKFLDQGDYGFEEKREDGVHRYTIFGGGGA